MNMELLIFLTILTWLCLLISALRRRRMRITNRLDEQILQLKKREKEKRKIKQGNSVWRRVLGFLSHSIAQRKQHHGLEKVQLRLLRAGSPSGLLPFEWIGLHLFVALCFSALGAGFLYVGGIRATSLAILLAFVLLGWVGPEFWLSRKITDRQNMLKKQLPGTLDLLTVSVEAGLGFDQALSQVAEEMSGPMAEEVQRVLREIQLGSPRLEALKRLAFRTGVDVIELFVSAVVQADKLGIGLTRVLRIQAAEVRRKQRTDAQEKAMKAPIKILFPLILFVFPALFIIVLGPAVIHIMQVFTNKG